MVSSWQSVISLIQSCLRTTSTWMSRDLSRLFLALRARMYLVFLQQVMWQTQFIVRELLQQVLVQKQLLRQTDIYNSFNRKICHDN